MVIDMKELAVLVSNEGACRNSFEVIDALNTAGFRKVFVQWYDKNFEVSQQDTVDYCKKQGLEIIFAHLGYQNINDIWLDAPEGEALVDRYCRNVDECKANGIDLVMMHLCSKSQAPGPNEQGLNRVRRIVEHATKAGVRLAFENTKIPGYQEYVLSRIPEAGNCYDAGHVHAHFHDEYNYEIFRDRFYCVHLHDNFGSEDEHLLPADGTLSWDRVLKKLKTSGYRGPLTLEIMCHRQYSEMDLTEFYREAFRRGKWLRQLWEKL